MLIFTLWSLPAFAWNAIDHQTMGRVSLQDVSGPWGLRTPCSIRPLSSLLEKLGKMDESLGDFWHFSDFLKINPTIAWDTLDPREQGKTSVTPLEILSFHSTDPDDGRDKDLIIRDSKGRPHYAFRDQFWFGSLQGGNSQAFRHLEKPPFSWKYRESTFGFPFRAVGEATSRAEIYYQTALLAFALEEDYWGWRFLAGSFHYLQDLENPYHAAQITPELLKKGFKAYWSWGRNQKKGLMPTLAHVVSNSHRFMETYLEQTPNYEPLKGDDVLPVPSIHDLSLQVRDESSRFFPALTGLVGQITNEKLIGPHLFNSNTLPYDDTQLYLDNESPNFAEANEQIRKIVAERFAATGRVLRTETKLLLEERKSPLEAKQKLQEIARLLALHPQKEP